MEQTDWGPILEVKQIGFLGIVGGGWEWRLGWMWKEKNQI